MLHQQACKDPFNLLYGRWAPPSAMLSTCNYRLPCYFPTMDCLSDRSPWQAGAPIACVQNRAMDSQVHNENGSKRVVVTKDLPGTRWLDVLVAANCRVEVCAHEDFILSQTTIKTLMSEGMRQCHGVIGQLTEVCTSSHHAGCQAWLASLAVRSIASARTCWYSARMRSICP